MEDDSLQLQSGASVRFPIRGMETVVATVSGYHGSERFKLIKLISQAGASYVGTMNQSTTHLVCWKFEGRKYELAGKFKTAVVNHGWIEECIKKGRRVLEHPYTLKCGQEVGPIQLVFPLISDKASPKLLAHSNEFNGFKEPVINIECEEIGDAFWPASSLLTKNLFPCLTRSQNHSYRNLKTKMVNRRTKRDYSSTSRNHYDEPLSDLLRLESEELNPETQLLRPKKKGKTLAEPFLKRRRLVKKNINVDNLESSLDSLHKCHPIQFCGQLSDVSALSKSFEDGRDTYTLRLGGASEYMFFDLSENRNEDLKNDEEIENLNDVLASGDSDIHTEGALSSLVRDSQDQSLRLVEGSNDVELHAGWPMSAELSCVICWTNFSSTRGILPCGHRFCFSCIQSWADHMNSNRKISTCPLCKASFMSITKVDDAVSSDQKIYSQTIPNDSSKMDVYILPEDGSETFLEQPSLAPVCSHCCCREPEDLLVRCQLCQIRCVHSYCLDPPLFPWTCVHCRDLQMLYNHIH